MANTAAPMLQKALFVASPMIPLIIFLICAPFAYPRHRAGDFVVILPLVRFLWPPELRLGYPFHHLENVYLF